MLQFENVCIQYGKTVVLSDLYAHIEKEKLTVLIGKNGSGKSSLLGCLIGQTNHTGRILLQNKPLDAIKPRERAKMLSFLPQTMPESALTVRQLTALGRTPYSGLGGRLQEGDRKIIEHSIARCDLLHLADKPLNKLSGGERKRAFLAMLLAQDTPFLVLDEPTAHLDTLQTAHFYATLQTLVHEEKKTVLFAAHDLNSAFSAADNVLCLHNKQAVFSGSKQKFIESDLPKTVFGLHAQTVTDTDGKTRTFFYTPM